VIPPCRIRPALPLWLALRAAFPRTLPVLAGYAVLGLSYGVLMSASGHGVGLTFLMSFLVFTGSMQYAAIPLLAAPFNPLYALLLSLLVSARHLFYGLSLRRRLEDAGRLRLYLIFALSDETFSLLSAAGPPPGTPRRLFDFCVAFLNRWYWISFSVLGAVLGRALPFDARGLEFSLTALFAVFFLERIKSRENRVPACIGLAGTALSLVIFGAQNFILPAMGLIALWLFLNEKRSGEASPCP
jgi:4-azaleucine resistance transporter AzlC